MSVKACGQCYGCWRGVECFAPLAVGDAWSGPGTPMIQLQLMAMDAHGALRDPDTRRPIRIVAERADSELVAIQRRRQPRMLDTLLGWYRGQGAQLLAVVADGEVLPSTRLEIVARGLGQMVAENAPEIMEAQYAQLGPLEPAQCKTCGADIHWIRTKAGRASPCNAKRFSITTAAGETVVGYESHYATCPNPPARRK